MLCQKITQFKNEKKNDLHKGSNTLLLWVWNHNITSNVPLQTPCLSNPCQHNSSCRTLYQLNDIWCECLPNYSGRYCSKYFEGVYIFLGNSNCHVVIASVLSILFNLTENESACAINFIPPEGRFCSGTIDVNFWSNASYHYRRSLRIGRIYLKTVQLE